MTTIALNCEVNLSSRGEVGINDAISPLGGRGESGESVLMASNSIPSTTCTIGPEAS